MIALVLNEIIFTEGKKPLFILIKVLSVLLIVVFGIKNTKDYFTSIKGRTYNILLIDNYLSKYDFKDNPIVGAWAPSVSWKSKAISYPVWKDYFNDLDVIKTQKPKIIIAEENEEDSGNAFSSKGIFLDSYADSIRYFTVNHWRLKLLWIKKPTH
jgi:hypothetical protein